MPEILLHLVMLASNKISESQNTPISLEFH